MGLILPYPAHLLLQPLVLLFKGVELVARRLKIAVGCFEFVVLLFGLPLQVQKRGLEFLVQILGVRFVLVDVQPQLLTFRVSLLESLRGG